MRWRSLAGFVCLTLLSACIEVDDFGIFAERIIPDERLFGVWDYQPQKIDGRTLPQAPSQFEVIAGDTKLLRDNSALQPNRTLKLGECRFAILGDWGLLRYELKENQLAFYYPDLAKVATMQKRGDIPGIIINAAKNMHIDVLNDESAKSLIRLCEQHGWIDTPIALYVRHDYREWQEKQKKK